MRVAIYVRVSTQRQAQTQTIEQQIERLKPYVVSKGWNLEPEHIYRDDGYSGAKLNRPGLDHLRDHAAMAAFELVVVTAPDRLARNYVHQVLVIEELSRRGVQVEFLDHPMSQDPHDQLLLQIRGAVAEYERTLIADRMRRGRLTRYHAGNLLPWSRPPYGYLADPEHPRDPALLKISLADAAVVFQMFDGYLEPGKTLYLIAKQLNELGLQTPSGKDHWYVSSIRAILQNPVYTGTTYANRSQPVLAKQRRSPLLPIGSGQSKVPRPPEEWIPISVPAIVSQSVFDHVQAKLSLNQKCSPRNNKTYTYLLRSLVSCGQCHLSTTARTLHGGYPYYICHGRTDSLRADREERCIARFMPAKQLDELVWQDVCAVLTHPEMIAFALERAHGGHWAPQELQAQIDSLTKARKQLEHQQERLLEAYLADIVKLPELDRKRNELNKKQAAIQTQLAQIQTKADERIELGQVADSIEGFCAKIRPVLDRADFNQRRQLVELLLDRVIVNNSDVEIRYVIPTRSEGPYIPFSHLRTDYRGWHQGNQTGFLSQSSESAFRTRDLFAGSHDYFRRQLYSLGSRMDRAACPAK